MRYRTRFVHKISSRQFEYDESVLEVPEGADQKEIGAILRKRRILHSGGSVQVRREPAKILAFPRGAGSWHCFVMEKLAEEEFDGVKILFPVVNRPLIREALAGLDGELVRPGVVEKIFPELFGRRYFEQGSWQPLTAVLRRLGAEIIP